MGWAFWMSFKIWTNRINSTNSVPTVVNLTVLQCLAYWERVKGGEQWGPEWSLRALAAAQRVQLSLSAFADNIYGLVQPHAESFR